MDIPGWIRAVESASHNLPKPASDLASLNFPNTARKRKTISGCNLASPPFSNTEADGNMTTTPQKRPRLENGSGMFDSDATPRPGFHRSGSARSSSTSAASDKGSASRSISRASSTSTKRQKMALRLEAKGVDSEPLNENTVPGVAKTLFLAMTDIGRCQRIIPHLLKSDITKRLEKDEALLRRWEYSFKHELDNLPDNLPGQIPSFEEIEVILARATECASNNHEEASWNAEVHLRLLHAIFENPPGRQCGNFNAMLCNTARSDAQFKPISSNSKMIDACVYASLNQINEKDAIMKFSKTTPTLSVNHTDFQPIQLRPLILSIETKKPGEGSDKAQLQISVWLAAKWNFLYWAARQKLLEQRRGTPLGIDEEEIKAETLAVLLRLPFIPGIFIQGNDWQLVISTYTDGMTKIWSGLVFGKTAGLQDIYAIVAGVRQLTAWGRDIYLPWFKDNILTLG